MASDGYWWLLATIFLLIARWLDFKVATPQPATQSWTQSPSLELSSTWTGPTRCARTKSMYLRALRRLSSSPPSLPTAHGQLVWVKTLCTPKHGWCIVHTHYISLLCHSMSFMSDSDPGSLEVLNFDPNQSGPLFFGSSKLKNSLHRTYGIFVEHLQILPIFTITIQAVKPPHRRFQPCCCARAAQVGLLRPWSTVVWTKSTYHTMMVWSQKKTPTISINITAQLSTILINTIPYDSLLMILLHIKTTAKRPPQNHLFRLLTVLCFCNVST